MATRYTQNVAIVQIPFQNLPGGGPVSGPTYSGVGAPMPIQFNDAGVELGKCMEVTAIYQLQGNESVNDIINIYLAQPGSMLDPAYSSVSASTSTSATERFSGERSRESAHQRPMIPPPTTTTSAEETGREVFKAAAARTAERRLDRGGRRTEEEDESARGGGGIDDGCGERGR